MRGLRRSSGPVANFGSCDQDLFVPTGSEACGNTRGACFLNLPYRQDFMYCLWAWTLEPECLDLSPKMVLGWFLESRFWLGGMFIGACAEVYNTCEGVKEVRWGRRSRWSRYDGSQGLCWSPWELWSWADPSELPCVEVREPGLSTPCQPAVRWGLSLDRAVTLAQVTLRSKTAEHHQLAGIPTGEAPPSWGGDLGRAARTPSPYCSSSSSGPPSFNSQALKWVNECEMLRRVCSTQWEWFISYYHHTWLY